MGCDGYLYNPENRLTIDLYCYHCGTIINEESPIKGHEACISEWNGRDVLKVIVESDIEFR